MAKEPKKLDDLFHDTLKDIYYAERKILTALPKMAKAAQSVDLRSAFEKHLTETEGQVGRLEQVFDLRRRWQCGRPGREARDRDDPHSFRGCDASGRQRILTQH
jgi:Domain of unknown function (DUF892)